MSFTDFTQKIFELTSVIPKSIDDVTSFLDDDHMTQYIEYFEDSEYNKAISDNIIKYYNPRKTGSGTVIIDGVEMMAYSGEKYDFVYLELYWLIYATNNIDVWMKLYDICDGFVMYYNSKK